MQIIVIGGGVTGLFSGHELARRGHKVTLLEKAPTLGGLAGGFEVGGTSLEKYYHHFFGGHTALFGLLEQLGLSGDLVWHRARMGFYFDGNLYPFETPMDLLRFGPLPFFSRIRLGLSSIAMKRIKDYRTIESESAISFLRRYTGAAASEIIWKPLLKMKFGEEYERISAAWIWNRITDRRKSAKGVQGERLGYLRGGLQRISDAAGDSILRHGGEVRTGVGVERILIENGECRGVLADGTRIGADAVLTTVPNRLLLRLAPDLPADYAASLERIEYQGSLCCILSMRRRLSDFYWINVSSKDLPFVGVIEHTNFMPPEDYGGTHLVYLGKYLADGDPYFAMTDGEIASRFAGELSRMFPAFDPSTDLVQSWVFRAPHTQPVFTTGYSRIMPSVTTPVKRLYLANTTQIYPESRALNSSVMLAQRATREILGESPDGTVRER